MLCCNIFEVSSGSPLRPTQPRIQPVPEVFRGGKAVRTWRWPLKSIWCRS